MKIGILNAVYKKDIIDGDREADKFIRLFDMADASFDYQVYAITDGEFPQSVDECDAYLITGSIQGVYDSDEWITPLQQFIRNCFDAQQKMVGICFGHQVLAHTLGGEARKSEKGWGLGLRPFQIEQHKPWMTPQISTSQLNFIHQDQVITLPEGAERLASNDHCQNAMFVINDRVLGIQPHPEYYGDAMNLVLDYLAEHDGLDVSDARDTQQGAETDSGVFANWIVNFLQYNEEPK